MSPPETPLPKVFAPPHHFLPPAHQLQATEVIKTNQAGTGPLAPEWALVQGVHAPLTAECRQWSPHTEVLVNQDSEHLRTLKKDLRKSSSFPLHLLRVGGLSVCLCAYLCLCANVHVTAHVWRAEDSVYKSSPLSTKLPGREGTQAVRPGGECLDLLSYRTGQFRSQAQNC